VAARALRTGARLTDERKRKAEAQGQLSKLLKRYKGVGSTSTSADADSHLIIEGKDNNKQLDLVLYIILFIAMFLQLRSSGCTRLPRVFTMRHS
jgi:hypothetical protein